MFQITATTEKQYLPHFPNKYLYLSNFNSLSWFLRFLKIRRNLIMYNFVNFYISNVPHIKERYLVCIWYKILPLLCRQLCFGSSDLTHPTHLNSVHLHMHFNPIHCPQGTDSPLKISQVSQVF